MKNANLAIFVSVILIIMPLLSGCTSKTNQRDKELQTILTVSSNALLNHDMDTYAQYISDDFILDAASAPELIGREDFLGIIQHIMEGDMVHYQKDYIYSGSDFVYFDECITINKHPETGYRFKVFHCDLIEFAGDQMEVMTSYGDGALDRVALGQIQPPLPAPPLPSQRIFGLESIPTNLNKTEAQKEFITRWNSHDILSVGSMIHDDASILVSPIYDYCNKEAFIGWMDIMFKAFPDMKIEEERIIEFNDNQISSEVLLTGTNSGSYLGNRATGKPISVRGILFGQYDSKGLMTSQKIYFDSMSIMNALELEPEPL